MKLMYKFLSIFMLAFLVTACNSDVNTPENVSEKFITHFYAGDASAILKLIHIKDSDKTDDFEKLFVSKFEKMAQDAKKFAEKHNGLDKVENIATDYTNDAKTSAMVNTKITFKDGFTRNEKIPVIKIDNKWLIKLK
ncbi:DUF4878 domain-containing protein [Frischella sp. Ac48]|uniref:DUF4878 domain-containing protein n=1 Tax=Frischella japonica TaxID=2741544 RepID=A0ABR7QYU1_9GAMM|nr:MULTISPECIES: DUF4878 domain-containing protein [Frischella]MBC9131392.1 DUF4878 domain-containing protein [Frischella japonica]MBX4132452.1 DUF4878 domain-containing protein [Frischella sp. Ac48]